MPRIPDPCPPEEYREVFAWITDALIHAAPAAWNGAALEVEYVVGSPRVDFIWRLRDPDGEGGSVWPPGRLAEGVERLQRVSRTHDRECRAATFLVRRIGSGRWESQVHTTYA